LDQALKCLLNNMRCPLCRGQIDVASTVYMTRVANATAYCCATSSDHYQIYVADNAYTIDAEMVSFIDGDDRFMIHQNHWRHLIVPLHFTKVKIYKVDAEGHYVDETTCKVFDYNKQLFDFAKTNREKNTQPFKNNTGFLINGN
jgi:hypothetical protein